MFVLGGRGKKKCEDSVKTQVLLIMEIGFIHSVNDLFDGVKTNDS